LERGGEGEEEEEEEEVSLDSKPAIHHPAVYYISASSGV